MIRRSVLSLAALLALSGGAAAQPVDLSACQFLTAHRPAPGVEYTPGVDVNGKAVAPADLPGSAGAAPPLERFDIPVTVDFARRMGFPVPQGAAAPGVEVGYLTWYANRLYFNGQPIGAPSEAEVYAYCRTVR
ncbi:hypothetical protein TSH58p_05810 [Azospirillum sp. TSH58]|uniref:hypothetical protein n=1 Tax=Azospirillum sp. TSH58 TaxID=664962 RepID=UPI000D602090|nr:hypothetical protein [Azospirillum sp. TSH58]AWJ83083.1 hypothetical protein TSH58p_05810 [Azospirillum sp. TSH58]PWC63310.1 hypothetical protein TSH58_24050 [Azospirillum sp. TSH58]